MARVSTKAKLTWQQKHLVALRNAVTATKRRIAKLKKQLARETPKHPTGVSQAGVDLIAEFEGFSAKPYDQLDGHCTVGYGTLLHYGKCTPADIKRWPKGISKTEAKKYLRTEANHAAQTVIDVVRVPLNQNQLDALTSFVYNCGAGALMSSTLLKKLNAGDYKAIPSELNRWVYSNGQKLPGLVTRRKEEGKLFSAR